MPHRRSFLGFGARLFLVVTAGLLVSNALLYYLTDYSLGKTYYDAMMMFNVARHSLMTFTVSVHIFVHIAVLVLVFIASLLMSHRVSGPMYRFEKNAEAMADGDFTVVARLRDRDFMKEQAAGLNDAVENIRLHLINVRENVQAMKQQAATLQKAAGEGNKAEAEKALDALRASSGSVRKDLTFFKAGKSQGRGA